MIFIRIHRNSNFEKIERFFQNGLEHRKFGVIVQKIYFSTPPRTRVQSLNRKPNHFKQNQLNLDIRNEISISNSRRFHVILSTRRTHSFPFRLNILSSQLYNFRFKKSPFFLNQWEKFAHYKSGHENYVLKQSLGLLYEELRMSKHLYGPHPKIISSIYNKMGNLCLSEMEYDKAEDYFNMAISQCENSELDSKQKDPLLVKFHLKICDVYLAQGKMNDATLKLEELVKSYSRKVDICDENIINALRTLTSVYSREFKYKEAIKVLETFIVEKHDYFEENEISSLGEVQMGKIFYELAEFHLKYASYQDSLDCSLKSLKYFEENENDKGVLFLILRSKLCISEAYFYLGQLEVAKNYLSAVYESVQTNGSNIDGVSKEFVSDVLRVLGTYMLKMRDLSQAHSILLKAYECLPDEKSISIKKVKILLLIGFTLSFQSKTDESVLYFEKALELIRTQQLHPLLSEAQCNLGIIFEMKKAFDKALYFFNESIANAKKYKFQRKNMQLLLPLKSKASLMWRQKRYKESIKLYNEALDVAKAVLGYEHPDVSYILVEMAFVCFEIGEKTQGLVLMKRGLQIQRERLGDEHPDTQVVKKYLDAIQSEPDDKSS